MKKIFLFFIAVTLLVSASSCASGENNESSLDNSSTDVTFDVSVEYMSEAPSMDMDAIERFPNEKIETLPMEDGEFYLKIQTVKNGSTCIREFAEKGDDAYSSIRAKDDFEWYYSDGKTTFSFDDEKKIYEVYAFSPLFVNFFFDGKKLEDGECVFFDVPCKFVKYETAEDMSIMHFYRKTDNSWLGFQYMYKDTYEEVNLVLELTDDIPSHVSLKIPDDYTYYFHQGENSANINWD